MVPTTIPKNQWAANGVLTEFNYTFPVSDPASELVVTTTVFATKVTTPKVYGVDYLTATAPNRIIFFVAPSGFDYVTITRRTTQHQTTDYVVNGPLNLETLEADLDRLTKISQELQLEIKNSFRIGLDEVDPNLPVSSGIPPIGLVERSGKIMGFDANGAFEFKTLQDIADLVDVPSVAVDGSIVSILGAISLENDQDNPGVGMYYGTNGLGVRGWLPTVVGGTVTNVSVVANNGITQSVANPTTNAIITLGLAAITPTTIAGTDATDATSTVAAAMKTAGGLAVAKRSYFGDSMNLIGGTQAYRLNLSGQVSGGATAWGILDQGTIAATVTGAYIGHQVSSATAAAAFVLGQFNAFYVAGPTIGAGSSITVGTGYRVVSSFTTAGTNFGFRGEIPAGGNRYNLYMDGTAQNYLAGQTGIGGLPGSNARVTVGGNHTGVNAMFGVYTGGTVQSDVTNSYTTYQSAVSTQAVAFNLANVIHFSCASVIIGAGSSVSWQYGYVAPDFTGATNNYGFYGAVSAGVQKWNLYMVGTATNFLNGNTLIGTNSEAGLTGTGNLRVNGQIDSSGVAKRFTADMSNATVANRFAVQTNVANGFTAFNVLPNGTGAISSLNVFNSSDPANSGVAQLVMNATEAYINSGFTGGGALRPFFVKMDGTSWIAVATTGQVSLGNQLAGMAKQLNVYHATDPQIFLYDGIGQNYGGGIRGYFVAGQGGYASLGTFQAGTWNPIQTINHLGHTNFNSQIGDTILGVGQFTGAAARNNAINIDCAGAAHTARLGLYISGAFNAGIQTRTNGASLEFLVGAGAGVAASINSVGVLSMVPGTFGGNEAIRIINDAGFISIYNSGNTQRNCYLQANGVNVTLAAEQAAGTITFQTVGSPRLVISNAGAIRFPSYGAGYVKSDASGNLTVSASVLLAAVEAAATVTDLLHSIVPNQTGNAGKVLSTDGVSVSWQPAGGYSVTANSAQFNPNDLTTYYFGIFASLATTTVSGVRRQYIPRTGSIHSVVLNWLANATAGSGEGISMYVRVNDATDYLIATVSNTSPQKLFANYALNIPVVQGDFFEIKLVTPTWATDPTQVTIGGSVYIE